MTANKILDEVLLYLFRHRFNIENTNFRIKTTSKYGSKITDLLLRNNSIFLKKTRELFREYDGAHYPADFIKFVKGDGIYKQTLNKIKKELQNDYTKEYFSN
jgi:hypothetical protein